MEENVTGCMVWAFLLVIGFFVCVLNNWFDAGYFLLYAVAPVITIIYMIIWYREGVENRKKMADNAHKAMEKLDGMEDFCVSKMVLAHKDQNIFAVDEVHKKFAIVNAESSKVFAYQDILSVALVEDGKTVISRSTERTIGGAVVGGLIAGEAGAVVGGMSGDQTVNKNVSKIVVRIVVKSVVQSSVEFVCHEGMEIGADSPYGKEMMKAAREIVDIVNVIIDEVERTMASNEQPKPVADSVTDELMKLASLKEKGLLTDEEFNAQKARLQNKH